MNEGIRDMEYLEKVKEQLKKKYIEKGCIDSKAGEIDFLQQAGWIFNSTIRDKENYNMPIW